MGAGAGRDVTLREAGVAGVAAGAACVAAAYLMVSLAPQSTTPAWLLAAGNVLTMSSAVLLGARRGTRTRWLVASAVAIALLLAGALGAALLLPPEDPTTPLVLGLPRRLAWIVYGVGILPACFLPLAFARDFTDDGLDPDGLAALRRDAAALREPSR